MPEETTSTCAGERKGIFLFAGLFINYFITFFPIIFTLNAWEIEGVGRIVLD